MFENIEFNLPDWLIASVLFSVFILFMIPWMKKRGVRVRKERAAVLESLNERDEKIKAEETQDLRENHIGEFWWQVYERLLECPIACSYLTSVSKLDAPKTLTPRGIVAFVDLFDGTHKNKVIDCLSKFLQLPALADQKPNSPIRMSENANVFDIILNHDPDTKILRAHIEGDVTCYGYSDNRVNFDVSMAIGQLIRSHPRFRVVHYSS